MEEARNSLGRKTTHAETLEIGDGVRAALHFQLAGVTGARLTNDGLRIFLAEYEAAATGMRAIFLQQLERIVHSVEQGEPFLSHLEG